MLIQVIDQALTNYAPSFGEDLAGFTIDAEFCFGDLTQLDKLVIGRTADPRALLEVRAQCTDASKNLQDLSDAVFSAWSNLCFKRFQASDSIYYREGLLFRFATAGNSSLLLTGRVWISGGHYGTLAADFERTYGVRVGSLPSVGTPPEDI